MTDEKPPTTEESSGRARLVGAMRTPTRGQAVVAVLLGALGFAAVTQVRANEEDDTYAGLRQQDLIQVLNGLAGTSQRAQNEISRLEETRDDLQSSTSSRQAALEQARTESDTLGILAGTLAATGPGLRITVTDPGGVVGIDTLLDAVQELRVAGAEAMEVNDQVRVIAQTSLEDGEGGILVDGQPIEAPYVIDVIGEPTTLTGALEFPGGLTDTVAETGGSVAVRVLDEVGIESVREQVRPDFAEPDPGQ